MELNIIILNVKIAGKFLKKSQPLKISQSGFRGFRNKTPFKKLEWPAEDLLNDFKQYD